MQLRGMTWDHPRAVDPLVAASAQWERRTGVAIAWDARSLQDFETYPVKELAERYDLIVIDHPHVGQITAENCLVPLEDLGDDAERRDVERGSLGASFQSYCWEGRQWALPIDAAAQVQAWQPQLIGSPALSWAEVVALAGEGRVHCPMRPPHSLMSLYTLCGLLGRSPRGESAQLFDPVVGAAAYRALLSLTGNIDPACFEMDPIAVLENMAQPHSRIALVPLIYGYVSYSLEGFRNSRIAFADLATFESGVPAGSALGGTGIAVSAFSRSPDEAVAFAYWLASADVQRGLYASAGGQPAHSSAWSDAAVNAPVLDFYSATKATLESAWVRPRHDGYMGFQQAASDRINAGLRSDEDGAAVIADLNRLYRNSR
jgi:multiple sugar transport system substrate-binding protein